MAVGRSVVEESIHLLVIVRLVHHHRRSPLVGGMDGDGVVVLDGFDGPLFLLGNVGRRWVELAHETGAIGSQRRRFRRLWTEEARAVLDSRNEINIIGRLLAVGEREAALESTSMGETTKPEGDEGSTIRVWQSGKNW